MRVSATCPFASTPPSRMRSTSSLGMPRTITCMSFSLLRQASHHSAVGATGRFRTSHSLSGYSPRMLDRVIEAPTAAAHGTSPAPPDSLGAVWRTYGYWAFWVGVAFFGVYPTCNWWTAQRAHRFGIYLAAELDVPL